MDINKEITTTLDYKEVATIAVALATYEEKFKNTKPEQVKEAKQLAERLTSELYDYQEESVEVSDFAKNMKQWKTVTPDIDFSKLTPIGTSNSLHVSEAVYLINGVTYRTMAAISDYDLKPIVEMLIEDKGKGHE